LRAVVIVSLSFAESATLGLFVKTVGGRENLYSPEGSSMTVGLRIVLLNALLLTFAAVALAQTSAGQSAEELRAQLRDVETKQTELEERARQLDEDLKPENIERSLALTGSTKPEELREQRRHQLEKERESVRAQADQLAASRTRLEAAIATADAEAYRRGALAAPTASPMPVNTVSSPQPATSIQPQQPQPRRRRSTHRRRPRRRRT
jgi:cell division protein FtsB